jgi:hypothetical protein
MCGDLDEYNGPVSVESLLAETMRTTGTPSIPASKTWASEMAQLNASQSNRELLAHVLTMTKSLTMHHPDNDQPENIAQIAQVYALASGLLTGLLLDDGTLQRIGLSKFLEGFSLGRNIEKKSTNSSDHQHGHGHEHGHPDHHH